MTLYNFTYCFNNKIYTIELYIFYSFIINPFINSFTSIVNDKYKFVIAEFNACTGSYKITKDYGEFGEEVINPTTVSS